MPEVQVINGRRVIVVPIDSGCEGCVFEDDAFSCSKASCVDGILVDVPTGRDLYALGYVPTNLFHPE